MKRLLLIVSLFSISLSEAKFPFKVWKGVEKSLKKIGLKSEDLHPVLGKFYYDILSNLRLMSGLYEKGEKNKEIPIESEMKDFASLLQMLFPSNAGIFMPSSEKCELVYHFTPRDFGAVVKAIYTNKIDELKKMLSECLTKCQSEILEKKKKDIRPVA
jgi:hypothetical protein